MTFDGRFADRELISNVFVSVAAGNQSDYVDFAFSQLVICRVISQLSCNFWWDSFLSCVDGSDRLEQFLMHLSFKYVRSSSCFERTQHLHIAGICRQDD